MGSCIPGYDEAVDRERDARNLIYLGRPEIVCGERINNITPYLFAVLTAIRTPFLTGGSATHPHAAQFLWACHVDYSPQNKRGIKRMLKVVSRLQLSECIQEIENFLELTFLDAQHSGAPSKPIASTIAWLVYRFRCPPFRMSKAETMQTPLRELYQELKCWAKDNNVPVENPSDKISGLWLDQITEHLRRGDVTPEELDTINQRN